MKGKIIRHSYFMNFYLSSLSSVYVCVKYVYVHWITTKNRVLTMECSPKKFESHCCPRENKCILFSVKGTHMNCNTVLNQVVLYTAATTLILVH